MASIVGIAYNPGTPINNTEQYGAIAVSFLDNNLSGDYGGVKWWASPDLDLRYIIAHTVPDGSQPNPLGIPAYVGFWGSEDKTDESFLYMVNNIPPRKGKSPFSNASEASNWLTTNGYWNSYGFDVQKSFIQRNAGILSRFYYRCDGGDNPSFIFIPHEDYSSISAEYTNVIKWFDGNCYYKSDKTTYTNDYTVAAEWGFNNCDACLSDCTLDENIFTVNCKLIVNVVSETPPPSSTSTSTPSPTPTKTPPCINPDLDIVSCDLNGDVTSTYYSLRLEACCEEYSAQTNYSIVKYFEFSGISPEIGGVIVYNDICYEILLYSSVNSLENITIEPDPITYMFIGETPCITCIDNVSDCTNFETATPTPTPTVTPNFRDIITVRLVECCTGIEISTSIDVETSVPIYLNDVIVINNKCHTVTGILPYQGGLVISIDSNSHFSNSLENPCRECYNFYDDCGGKPTPTPTTSPTVIPEDYLVSARACCGNPKPYTIQLYLTSIAYNQLQPGDGIYYNDICYEIVEDQLLGPIVGAFDENDIRRSICEYCCGTTPTSTPTPTSTAVQCVSCKGINMSFIVDITSSMGDTIDTMKNNIGEFVSSLESQTNVYSLGLSVFDEDTSSQPNYAYGLSYLNLPSSQKIVTESNGVYQYHTSVLTMSNQNGSTFLNQFDRLNDSIWFPLGWGNLDPDPVNESIKYVLNGFTNAVWGNPNDDEYNFISIFTDALPGGEDEIFNSLDESESEIIKNQLLSNNIRLLFFTSNQDTFNESPLTQISFDTGGKPFLTNNPIEDLKNYIDNLCCDLPSPTPTRTPTTTPTSSVTPTRTPTPTPTQTIPIVFDSNVEINFWFDDSGSASNHLPSIQGMVNNYLQSCLLPFYNNSILLYTQRVNIFYMGDEGLNERGFRALSQTGTTAQNKVINIVLQDEALPIYHGNNTWSINDNRTQTFDSDITLLRNRLNSVPDDYLKGAWIHLSGAGDNQAQLYQLLQAVENGNGQYSGNYGLSDFNNDIKYHYWVNESSYYLTQLIINTINSFGYNIPVC